MRINPKTKEISLRDKAIIQMRREGKTIIEIGEFFSKSRQRIWQILEKYGDPLDEGLDK